MTDINAVSYRIVSLVLGSYQEGDSKFDATTGAQCACNSLLAVFWSVIHNVHQW